MTLPEVLTALKRSAWLVVLLMLVCLAGSAAVVAVQQPAYQATAKVIVSSSSSANANDNIAFAQQVVPTYATFATTSYVLTPVAQRLGLSESGDDLAQDVTAVVATDQLIISITATRGTAQGASDLANAVASQLPVSVKSLTPTTKTAALPISVVVVERATPPARPIRPAIPATLLAGLIAGLVLGIVAAIVRARLDTRVRSPKELEAAFDKPVLGVLPGSSGPASAIVTRTAPDGPVAEAYRALRTNLEFLGADERVDSIVVTSAMPGEGKTTCAINLGVVTAKAGKRVLVVEGDLRKPRVAAYTGIDGGVGITDVLIGRTTLEQAVQQWGPAGLSVLPAGSTPPNPSELLHSKAMADLALRVRGEYDLVLFDSPPLTAVTDAAILARLSSGAVIACALGHTKGPQTEAALDALQKAQATVLGFVATFARSRGRGKAVYGDPRPRSATSKKRSRGATATTPPILPTPGG